MDTKVRHGAISREILDDPFDGDKLLVRATCQIFIPYGDDGNRIIPTLHSPGISTHGEDNSEEYLDGLYEDEEGILLGMLAKLGVTPEPRRFLVTHTYMAVEASSEEEAIEYVTMNDPSGGSWEAEEVS